MKEGFTEVLAVLDKSAQAEKTAGATVAAYNDLLAGLKKADAVWTTVTFGADAETVYDRARVKDVKKLVKKDFAAGGRAALFDTVGKAVDGLGVTLSKTAEEERPSKVIVLIGTAGIDNASKKYSLDEIKAKIDHQRQVYSWEFIFAGADVSAFKG
ncbi:MAG: hypothetical protein LBT00_10305 [Spirochaetaceae bacterium]|jgi:hypothetical protein|nr:hypothetical protein [Spirochaetaceae bacterium]